MKNNKKQKQKQKTLPAVSEPNNVSLAKISQL